MSHDRATPDRQNARPTPTDPLAREMSGPLTEQEQHEALSHLHACLEYDEQNPSSDAPNFQAIAALLDRFTPTQLWDRGDGDG